MSLPALLAIRDARPVDADAMTALRAASIRDLCAADHDNGVHMLEWIGAPDKFARLFERRGVTLVVAEMDGVMAGLGGVEADTVTLNYVHPRFRLQGVSKAILLTLEARLAAQGIRLARLYSTATALRFYRAMGWGEAGQATAERGQPMTKQLSGT